MSETIAPRVVPSNYQELLDTDTRPVPPTLRVVHPAMDLGDGDVSIDRYISREWHEREKELLWRKVWQFACREEELPAPGDHVVYDIVGLSFLVVRQDDGSIKAFPNACLHRGRMLKDHEGSCSELRCPYHGYTWALDGSLKFVPARYEFPQVVDDDFHLTELPVGRWNGFVFINPDPHAAPFDEFIADLAEQFEPWDLSTSFIEVHISKVILANWKVTQEAFCEAYHVGATHPQIMAYLSDTATQVDVWRNASRAISPAGLASALLPWEPTEADMMRSMLDVREGEPLPVQIPDGGSMRAIAADLIRDRWRPIVGERVETMSDAELMDSLDYTLFPNFHPWGAFNRIVYRFRPNGDDHRTSIMEVYYLSPFDGERPPPATVHELDAVTPWTEATELGMLAKVFEQDTFNMAKVQRGLEATYKPGVTLAAYQESKVRWLHHRLDEYVNGASS